MSYKSIKTGFVVALLSSFLVACSSTTSTDTAGDGSSAGSSSDAGSSVSTDSVGSGGVSGGDLGAGGVATVFYFDFDKSTLKSEARAALNIHAQRLRANPRYVRLEGHADERGTREYNMALGERRATAVKEFLVLQGVNGDLLEVISYGEERPAALGSDSGSWGLNRRVEMSLR